MKMQQGKKTIRTLLIEYQESDATHIQTLLDRAPASTFDITHIRTLQSIKAACEGQTFDLMLLSFTLPDSKGLAAIRAAQSAAPGLPIVVLSPSDHEDASIQALQQGAQDFLIKDELTDRSLGRLLAYALERHRLREQLHKLNKQQKYLATHDVLTGLPNRKLLQDRLRQTLAQSERYHYHFAVIFLDIDGFKKINDSFGHTEGDQLLKSVAGNLAASIRCSDTIARIGGDEFIILINRLSNEKITAQISRKILNVLRRPLTIQDQEIFISGSIGIALYPQDGTTPDDLMKNADIAMYKAKEMGKNTFCFYTKSMNELAHRQLQLSNDLYRAIDQDELFLEYQPQLDATTRRLIGFEALVRWHHPELNLISPAEFIPIAEENGLIIPLGEKVLRLACKEHHAWHDMLDYPFRMAINLSARQFIQQRFVPSILKILNQYHVPADAIDLELTESIIMDDSDHVISKLNQLKECGFHLSIDDFGTGYSSLNYLKQLPIDLLKIDRSFVGDIQQDVSNASIVRTIIALARNLGLDVLAEGVETAEQRDFLLEEGCRFMQGYWFSRPLPRDQAIELLVECQQGRAFNTTCP